MGQTTGFKKDLIKGDVLVMGETKQLNEARYIHGVIEKGFFTFYGGASSDTNFFTISFASPRET